MILLIGAAYAADCGDREALLQDLEDSVVTGDIEVARSTLADLTEAFGCGGVADAHTIARVWLVQAVLHETDGLSGAADRALASAARLSPTTWTEEFGSELKARWQVPHPTDFATVYLIGLPPGFTAAIDGSGAEFPLRVGRGLHLLQVQKGGQVRHAQIFDLDSQDIRIFLDSEALVRDAVVAPPVPSDPVPPFVALPPAAAPTEVIRERDGHPVRNAVLLGLLAGGMFGVSRVTYGLYYDANPAGTERQVLWVTTNGLVGGSVSLGVVGVVNLGRGVGHSRRGAR